MRERAGGANGHKKEGWRHTALSSIKTLVIQQVNTRRLGLSTTAPFCA